MATEFKSTREMQMDIKDLKDLEELEPTKVERGAVSKYAGAIPVRVSHAETSGHPYGHVIINTEYAKEHYDLERGDYVVPSAKEDTHAFVKWDGEGECPKNAIQVTGATKKSKHDIVIRFRSDNLKASSLRNSEPHGATEVKEKDRLSLLGGGIGLMWPDVIRKKRARLSSVAED